MKIRNSQLDICQLEIKNKNISIFKKVGGISVLFYIINIGSYHNLNINFAFWIYTLIFMVTILIVFAYKVTTAYVYFKYVLIFLILTVLPSILISLYTFSYLLNTFYFLLLFLIYSILLLMLYRQVQKIKIDYVKSAKTLLKIYPDPFDLLSNKFHVSIVQDNKQDLKKSNNIFISILANIPPWILYTVPVFTANIGISYLSDDGSTLIMSGLVLLITFGFIYIGLVSYKNIYIFHEAQKILDAKEKKKKGQK